MASRMVNVSFDFENDSFRLQGMGDDIIQKSISELQSFIDSWTTLYYLEYPIGKMGEKWIFSWNQWADKEQYFRIKQYVPFPKTGCLVEPVNYKPWTILAEWSFVAHTKTTENPVYKRIYHPEFVKQNMDFSFEVQGKPAIMNWNTKQSISDY